jgi:hypothetical protein
LVTNETRQKKPFYLTKREKRWKKYSDRQIQIVYEKAKDEKKNRHEK